MPENFHSNNKKHSKIADPKSVNARRTKIGMEPLEEKTQELNAERIKNFKEKN